MLRAEYEMPAFEPGGTRSLFRYLDWLPPIDSFDTSIGPVVYRSQCLAEKLGLEDLAIAFSGYAPNLGAENPTGSFKDLEALPTLLFYREHGIGSVVVASAGNTARAFAYAATLIDFRTILVVPEEAVCRLWSPVRVSDAVRLVTVEASHDYAAAIRLAHEISTVLDVAPEGGARNVARRDGLGTVLLEYARVFGRLPRHYVQAIGSGTGGIAAWEASQRLLRAGVGDRPPTLHLAQNAPFAPIHDAWSGKTAIAADTDHRATLDRIAKIDAKVLANRNPPYGMPGGVRDALADTGGHTYAVSNASSRQARRLFEETEGAPICAASGIALGALVAALEARHIRADESILLHVTGNEDSLVRKDFTISPIPVTLSLRSDQARHQDIEGLASRLLE